MPLPGHPAGFDWTRVETADFVDHPWFTDYFKDGSPGLPLAEYEQRKK